MYAIVKTGGKQYRVEEGQSLLVERLPVDDGGKASLTPLLVVDGSNVVDGSDLSKVTIEARVVGHERGPKLRVVKFKPKRGYKRRTGHRQELTRIEVTSIKLASRRGAASAGGSASARGSASAGGGRGGASSGEAASGSTRSPARKPAGGEGEKPAGGEAEKPAADEGAAASVSEKPTRTRSKPKASQPKPEDENGA